MNEVGNLIRQGKIRPISLIKTFDVSELHHALLYFSKGQHIGKIVITYDNKMSIVRVSHPP